MSILIRDPLPAGFWLVILAAVILGGIASEGLGRFIIWRDDRSGAKRPASVDTHPKGGDVQQAPAPLSGAVDSKAGETPQ